MSRHLTGLAFVLLLVAALAMADEPANRWQQPDADIMKVLHAPQLPWVWTAPSGQTMLLADPIYYPELAEMAAPMHKLAGMRVNPRTNNTHGRHGGLNPRLVRIEDGQTIDLDLPEHAELFGVDWTVDGERFALTVWDGEHMGLWVGSVDGKVKRVKDVAVNRLMGTAVQWLPDQKNLLVLRIPERGAPPAAPATPLGPMITDASGAAAARSTYEARNLLQSAHDDALFEYYATSQPIVVDGKKAKVKRTLADPAVFYNVEPSPDGDYLLAEYLVGPWSHEVAWWRFAQEAEVWDEKGKHVATVASLPLADQVPAHGVPTGPRNISWRATADHELFWYEALDGGDPVAEVDHRDRLMRLGAPFTGQADEVYRAEHRIRGKMWGEEGGTLMLAERERMRRWLYVWLLDVDQGTSRLWFDQDEADRYNSPGWPVARPLDNGQWVMRQEGDAIYFRGSGATPDGDRPFLDLRSLTSGEAERLFRSPADRYEQFSSFAGDNQHFIMRSESPTDVPNYYLGTFGEAIEAPEGEAVRAHTRRPITRFVDQAPELRQITKRIVRYQREDGVELNFTLCLPPGYEEGDGPLPTVVYAYPLEYGRASSAGQVRGSAQRFLRFWGPTHMYFLLKGYAVLDNTAMPMVGDPETVYDTFVEQLVADAEAAVAKAVDMGVADPERIGVIGHSHGGLMVANLLAHTDLFAAGIARSGSYNKTNQPFGFQSERRSLFEARDVYINVSPTFFAHQVNEPVLVIHGNDDSNPGTLTPQSEVFFEGVRGSGGTARLVLLPFEDHGYRARESVEHVIWEQLRWFDMYLKGEIMHEHH